MSDLNSCSFTGRVTRDAETTTVGSKGTSLTKFSIANNTGFGQYAKTQFFNCQVWGKQGEAIKQYLTKGKQVAVTGMLENGKWAGNDGVEHDSWALTVSSVTLLADSKNASGAGTGTGETPVSYDADGNSVF